MKETTLGAAVVEIINNGISPKVAVHKHKHQRQVYCLAATSQLGRGEPVASVGGQLFRESSYLQLMKNDEKRSGYTRTRSKPN